MASKLCCAEAWALARRSCCHLVGGRSCIRHEFDVSAVQRCGIAWVRHSSTGVPLKQLTFDLPRPHTAQEKREVCEELAEALAGLPTDEGVSDDALPPEDVQLLTKIQVICSQRPKLHLEQSLRLASDLLERINLSEEIRRRLAHDKRIGLSGLLRQAFEQRKQLPPTTLRSAASVALALLGPGSEEPTMLAEALLEELSPMLPSLPRAEAGSMLLAACARRFPSLPGAARMLEAALQRLIERLPCDMDQQELQALLAALGASDIEIEPALVEDLVDVLEEVWPMCSTATLLSALLNLGQAGILDTTSFRSIIMQLEAREPLLGTSDRESLLLLLALHKGAFDRAAVIPNPFYESLTERLVASLAAPYASRIQTAPFESLARPILALAELRALSRPARKIFEERLASGRLLSLPPSTFATLAYAHRLTAGPVPVEKLRRPLCLAFGALVHGMEPRQIASCAESLSHYAVRRNHHVFATAYTILAKALEAPGATLAGPQQVLTPLETSAAILTYAKIRLDDAQPLVRILRSIAASPMNAHATYFPVDEAASQRRALQLEHGSPQGVSMLARMSMDQLVNVLDAFGAQGLAGCGTVVEAVSRRYLASGGRMSRRNVARSLHALAMVGERPPEFLGDVLAHLDSWIEEDPHAENLKTRPALTILWSLCALGLEERSSHIVDWLLTHLCHPSLVGDLCEQPSKASLLFESLAATRLALPHIAAKHMQLLASAPSPVAERVLMDVGSPLPTPEAMLGASSGLQALLTEGGAEPREIELSSLMLGAGAVDDSEKAEGMAYSTTSLADSQTDTVGRGLNQSMKGRSALDELGLTWHMNRRRGAEVPKVLQALGEVLATLNVGRLLRTLPHPDGALAAESTRLTGGFELRWPSGPYDIDWGHPYLRIGILVLGRNDFVLQPTCDDVFIDSAFHDATVQLLAPARLRINFLRTVGWRLVLLRRDTLEEVVVVPRGSRQHAQTSQQQDQYFGSRLQVQVKRANAVYPLDASALSQFQGSSRRRSGRRSYKEHDDEQRETSRNAQAGRMCAHLAKQLELVFPGSVSDDRWHAGTESVTADAVNWRRDDLVMGDVPSHFQNFRKYGLAQHHV